TLTAETLHSYGFPQAPYPSPTYRHFKNHCYFYKMMTFDRRLVAPVSSGIIVNQRASHDVCG
ncbi:MAG TPA: hypothetical protein PK589_18590, partial [Nitrospira sp.]|nr:hypothetical protein [Nitrospira sp.]HMZ99102.1 hypothetical protein [Nitrospira sp.]HNJ21675.1 hypothetical protein [Nitrospira sp.]HNM20367.1 hypothetical protein [Nitrospira sp.]